ncbi:MAG: flagellar hook-basal body complex protein FliE [Lachnospiraceae bacterium]|nr:flagellar hook-basal body complex protein FliE [Lachnospiraceae bacterium]
MQEALKSTTNVQETTESGFSQIYQAAVNMLNETSELENNANTEEMKWAMGLTENAHDLTIAQNKASSALTYTIAVRDKVLEAYKEIINMQM